MGVECLIESLPPTLAIMRDFLGSFLLDLFALCTAHSPVSQSAVLVVFDLLFAAREDMVVKPTPSLQVILSGNFYSSTDGIISSWHSVHEIILC
jgi:hypothetical protein